MQPCRNWIKILLMADIIPSRTSCRSLILIDTTNNMRRIAFFSFQHKINHFYGVLTKRLVFIRMTPYFTELINRFLLLANGHFLLGHFITGHFITDTFLREHVTPRTLEPGHFTTGHLITRSDTSHPDK